MYGNMYFGKWHMDVIVFLLLHSVHSVISSSWVISHGVYIISMVWNTHELFGNQMNKAIYAIFLI